MTKPKTYPKAAKLVDAIGAATSHGADMAHIVPKDGSKKARKAAERAEDAIRSFSEGWSSAVAYIAEVLDGGAHADTAEAVLTLYILDHLNELDGAEQ